MSEIYLAAAIAFFALGFFVYLIADILANHAMEEQIEEIIQENKELKRYISETYERTKKDITLIRFSMQKIEKEVNQDAEK